MVFLVGISLFSVNKFITSLTVILSFSFFGVGLFDLCVFSCLFSIEDTSSCCSSLTILELSTTMKNLIPCFSVSTLYQFGGGFPHSGICDPSKATER